MRLLLALLLTACGPVNDLQEQYDFIGPGELGDACEDKGDCRLELGCYRRHCTVRCVPVKLKQLESYARAKCAELGGVCSDDGYDLCELPE